MLSVAEKYVLGWTEFRESGVRYSDRRKFVVLYLMVLPEVIEGSLGPCINIDKFIRILSRLLSLVGQSALAREPFVPEENRTIVHFLQLLFCIFRRPIIKLFGFIFPFPLAPRSSFVFAIRFLVVEIVFIHLHV